MRTTVAPGLIFSAPLIQRKMWTEMVFRRLEPLEICTAQLSILADVTAICSLVVALKH